jgi:hypothetical protein
MYYWIITILHILVIDAVPSSHHSKYRLAQEDVSNPHYVKTSLTDNNVGANKEESSSCALNNIQSYQTSKNEGLSQSAKIADESNNGDMYKFANYNQDRTIDYCHEPPGYAAVNRAEHSLRIEKSVQKSIDSEWFSPGYDEVGGHEVASKTVVMAKEQENPSPYIGPQKRSPSPVYAEVNKNKKKKQQQDHSIVVEERERSLSPEYSQVMNINKLSKDNIVNEENQYDEQHYYHSLENPEEHGCNGNNIIQEMVFTSEHSPEPQVVSTQSMLCETPDPDVTNTHTEITDSKVNTFPNPCYHTQV